MSSCRLVLPLLGALILLTSWPGIASDWPMWRHDPGRTATTPSPLPESLHLHWVRQLPPPSPAYRDTRLQFDGAIEPIVMGKRLFFGSNLNDSVVALDTETGEKLWQFFAEGPVRFAPVGGEGRILFGADDGCVYCLEASDGSLVWKHRAVPSPRTVIGNGRLISPWPIRGGPVLHKDRVYFAAGVWPLEGTFVFCLDAATGEVIWRNDRAAYLYGIHPHNAEAFGGLAPQGYLLIEGDDLVVPSSQAYPARFDLQTGDLKEFKLPAPGRLPGGWFASTPSEKEALKLRRRGLLFDETVNAKPHEDRLRQEGLPEIRDTLRTRDREWRFGEIRITGEKAPIPEVASAVAGNGRLFVTTTEGLLYCLGVEDGTERAPLHGYAPERVDPDTAQNLLQGLPAALRLERGHALFLGMDTEHPRDLVMGSQSRAIVVHSDRAIIEGWNSRRGNGDGFLPVGSMLATRLVAAPDDIEFPPYFADVIAVGKPWLEAMDADRLNRLFRSVRPYGGRLVSPSKRLSELAGDADLPRVEIETTKDGWTVITRTGAIEGSTNYTGDWALSEDENVRAPFGVLWFGDAVTHFKRSPQPKFVDGVMISNPKDWTDASTREGKIDYRLLETEFTDVYTGRRLASDEAPELRQSFTDVDRETIQPSQYRPPRQKDDWKPDAPRAGERVNPLTGETEARTFPKSYGCDGGVDYGLVYSMRSGTPAVYDKVTDSGTINISGPRSGCTNSVIPANGILNLPYFYEGCTCSYPLPISLALVGMPETFEQWASWGEVPAESLDGKIQRLGLNFGAPGDRRTRDGTLWLDLPNVGGPSPAVSVSTTPPLDTLPRHYQHSLFLKPGGQGWPWVAGSGVSGIREVSVEGLKPGRYVVRMTAREFETDSPSFRGSLVLPGKVPARITTRDLESVEVKGDGTLSISIPIPKGGSFLLCGLEIVRAGLPIAPTPQW